MNHALRTSAPALRALFAAAALVAASAAAPAASPLVHLGTLGGASTYGYDINDSGVVVGYETDAASVPTTAFRWTAATGIVPLSAIGAGTKAVAINAAGDAVGSDATHALFWAAGTTTATVLPDLGVSSPHSTADGINAAGQIVGYGIYNDGPGGLSDGTRAFVLDASSLVPEPAFLAFPLLTAAAAFGTPRRRRRNA